MQCVICQKTIKISTSIDTLFKKEKHHICERCYHEFPLYFDYLILPIEDYEMTTVVLSKIKTNQNPLAYMSYYKPFIVDYIKHKRTDIILIFDDLTQEIYNILDTLKLGDILVISLYISID